MELMLTCPKCSRCYQRADFERGEVYFECEHCQVELAQARIDSPDALADAPAALVARLPNWVPGQLRPSELGSKYGGITLLIAVAVVALAAFALGGKADRLLAFLPTLCVLSIVGAFVIGYQTQARRNRAAIALMPPPEEPVQGGDEVNPHRAPYG